MGDCLAVRNDPKGEPWDGCRDRCAIIRAVDPEDAVLTSRWKLGPPALPAMDASLLAWVKARLRPGLVLSTSSGLTMGSAWGRPMPTLCTAMLFDRLGGL